MPSPADPAPLLVAAGLVRAFGARRVLQGISLALQAGDVLVVAGANGAGKTTLLRCLAGLMRPTRGEVRIAGQRVERGDPASRRAVGLVSHQSLLYDDLTVLENLVFTARLYGLPRPAEVARAALAEVGLEARAGDRPRDLSRGMLQRAAIARALLHAPKVVLLDEPFTGLDAPSAHRFRALLRERIGTGSAVVLVTHHLPDGWELATQVGVLARGTWAIQEPRPASLEQFLPRYHEAIDG